MEVIKMDYKIIQIIPNHKNIFANYKDGNDTISWEIVCFCTYRDDGERTVKAMDINLDGEIDEAAYFN